MTRSPATARDIPGGLVLLVATGVALLGMVAHRVGDGLEWCAVALAIRVERRG